MLSANDASPKDPCPELVCASPFLVRVGGVPLCHALTDVGAGASAAVRDWLDARDALRSQGTKLGDALGTMVPSAADAKSRHAIISVRRDIFNLRAPSDTKVAEAIGGLPPALRKALTEWCRDRQRLDVLEARHRVLHGQETTQARVELRAALASIDLQRGLALASADVLHTVRRYLGEAPDKQSSKLSSQELSLIEYVTRAGCKTSPFSTFTPVVFGTWSEEDGLPLLVESGEGLRSRVQVNCLMLQRVMALALTEPGVRETLRYRLTRDHRIANDALTATVLMDDPQRNAHHYRVSEREIALPLSPPIECLLRILGTRSYGEGVRYDELVEGLASHGPKRDEERSRQFVDRLVASGILVPEWALPDQSLDLLSDAANQARRLGASATSLASALATIDEAMRVVGDGGPPERAAAVAKTRAALTEAARMSPSDGFTNAPVVYEDATLEGAKATASTRHWEQILEDLALLQQLQALWDPAARYRLAAGAFFRSRADTADATDVRAFLRALRPHSDEWMSAWRSSRRATEIGREIPSVQKLNALFGEFHNLMTEAISASRGEEAVLPREALRNLARRMPPCIRRRRMSNSVFGQLAGATNCRLVVNHFYPGTGRFFSRFLPLFDADAAGAVRSAVDDSFDDDAIPLEIPGVFGFNANLHPPLADHVLDFAELAAANEVQARVAMDDLRAEYDEETETVQLRHRRTGRVMWPFYPGFMIAFRLPPTLRMLAALFGDGTFELSPNLWAEAQLDAEARRRPRVYPRLMMGSVVIARRAWFIPGSAVLPTDARTDADFYRDLQEWSLTQGLPRRTFVRNLGLEGGEDESQHEQWQRILNAKPQLIDMQNPLHVRLLRKIWRQGGTTRYVFTEMLPDADDAVNRANGRVTEVMLELNARGAKMDGYRASPRQCYVE